MSVLSSDYPNILRVALSLISAVLLLGCGDTRYLIGSRGTLPADLEVHCIAQSLAGDPDGANAKRIGPSWNLPLDASLDGDPVSWAYGEGGHSYVTIDRRQSGWSFKNERFFVGNMPEAFGVSRFEPVMNRVNAAFAARCGLRITEHDPS